jgi:hypothetical protein
MDAAENYLMFGDELSNQQRSQNKCLAHNRLGVYFSGSKNHKRCKNPALISPMPQLEQNNCSQSGMSSCAQAA